MSEDAFLPVCSLFSSTWLIKTEVKNWLRFWSLFKTIFKEDKTSQKWMFCRNKDGEKLAKPQPSELFLYTSRVFKLMKIFSITTETSRSEAR